MKIVLTGGTGLIGGAIARRLASAGHEVVVLTRSHRADADGIRYLAWDGRTSGSWETEIAGAGAVMNLAGESVGSRWTRAKKERIAGSRVDATRTIVRAMGSSASRSSVLINASAVGYYGNVPEGEVTETTPPGKDLLGRTCVAWEAEARKAEQFGVRVVMLRTGFVIAREAEAFQRLILPYKLFV
ncbi:MAG: NAD-dependent epimerase/dehydratase family protein, partial [Ignavibacteriales bacterium]|nr:NAD-dependent epimerase/dehydratase family protein [Ignavibacteriales bacterium]